MPDSVADSSVVAAVLFREPEGPEALRLVSRYDVHAPHLLPYELTSVARKKTVANPTMKLEYAQGLQRWEDLPVELHDVSRVDVLNLALDRGLSAYDASYLHLALVMGAPLLTFDRRLKRAAEAVGVEAP
jgi:predicted nucleic acid-binding protein